MAFPRPSSPRAVWADLKAFVRGREKHQLIAAGAAIVIPCVLIAGFYLDAKSLGPKEQVIFVESWSVDRSDAEIVAQQKIDMAAREKRAAERQAMYKELQERTGTK